MGFSTAVNNIIELNEITAETRGVKPMLKNTLIEILSIVSEPVIAGGFAVSHYVRPRQTIDIDVVGMTNFRNYSVQLLALGYSHETNRLGNGVCLESFTKNKNTQNEEGIDFMSFDNEAFEKQVKARSHLTQMLAFKVSIVSIEDLIVMKSLSARTKDKADLEDLQKQPYDRIYVNKWVKKLKD